jgi:hypothetical protein
LIWAVWRHRIVAPPRTTQEVKPEPLAGVEEADLSELLVEAKREV